MMAMHFSFWSLYCAMALITFTGLMALWAYTDGPQHIPPFHAFWFFGLLSVGWPLFWAVVIKFFRDRI
jgi:hypothetical protein